MKLPIGFAVLLLSSGVSASAGPAPERPMATPVLQVQTLTGEKFDLAAHRGDWVIVNYWATWCSPCIEEMPAISAFVEQHDNVAAIGLAFEDTEEDKLRAFLDQHPVVYPIARVDVFNPPTAFGSPRGLPTTYVIAPDGTVAQKFVGPITAADLRRATGQPAE